MLKPQDSDIAPRSGSNTIAETKPAAQKDSHSITSGSAGTGSAFLVDHQPISRSRVGTTLPEKRTIGQRKPVTQTTGSQPQPPTSRLLKMTTTLPLMAPPAPTSGISASSQPQSSLTNTTGRAARPGIIGLSKDSQPTTQAVAAQTNSAVPSSASLNMWRQGAPRAPLPLTRPTESSLARSESQSALTRKPFLISKSTLLLKKPTRTVLQDSTLTARSLALSGIARAGTPTSPKKDTKRDIKLRELTPDVTSKTSTTSSASMQTLSTSSTSGTTMTSTLVSILAAQQSTSSTAKSLTNGLLRASRTQESQTRELQTEESTTSNKQLNDFNQSDNPFVAQSQTRRRSHHERTLLPEIISESEDDGDESRDGKRDRHLEIPAWAEWSELEKAMHRQSQLNPEDIFGPLPVLDMGEIFPVKPNRLRPRTSSAHWSTTDRLTVQEVIRYNEDMGWSAKE
ncbi:hypothetical protein BGZ54_000213 [Gamsiella multidivaricata]|nr:hypothetical protein BGZ54_000213 [Gamsiella multidivaricata]